MESRAVAKVHVQQSGTQEAAGQPARNTLVYTQDGDKQSKSHVRSSLTLGVQQRSPESVAEVLFATVSHHHGNHRAENQQFMSCQVAILLVCDNVVSF